MYPAAGGTWYRAGAGGLPPFCCLGTGNPSPAALLPSRPWDQTTGAPAHLKAAPDTLLSASFRTPLYLVMYPTAGGIRYRAGLPPCCCTGTGNPSPAALLASGHGITPPGQWLT